MDFLGTIAKKMLMNAIRKQKFVEVGIMSVTTPLVVTLVIVKLGSKKILLDNALILMNAKTNLVKRIRNVKILWEVLVVRAKMGSS